MEFIDHRPYRAGDDTRHIDAHLFARTGDFMMREYSLNQQLPVTLALDLSRSMEGEKGAKSNRARLVAQLFGFAALAGGDRVQVVVPTPRGNKLSPRWHGVARADTMFDWIAGEPVTDATGFPLALNRLREELPSQGMLIAISDWWDDELGPVLERLASAGHEVLAIQVLSPEEMVPSGMDNGVVTVEDIETGQELELVVDAGLLSRYRKLFSARQDELRTLFAARHWHFITVSTAEDIHEFFTRTLRAKGILA